MTHLGELAAARAETTDEPVTFDWHGKTIRCRTQLPALPLLEMASTGADMRASGNEDDFMLIAASFYRFLQSVIEPDDWSIFRQSCTDNADGADQLMPLVGKLGEAIMGRPTERPSDSPDGPPQTTGGSTATLPSRASTSVPSALAG
jgi:hypothetical protein